MLLGFASALRSASIAALTLDDIEFCEQGAILTIPREKQDQEGRGRFIGIPFAKSTANCAVDALRRWLQIRPTTKRTRALFVSVGRRNHAGAIQTEAIHRAVKRTVARIGLNPKHYGSHSLRSGFIIAAGEAGVTDGLGRPLVEKAIDVCLREHDRLAPRLRIKRAMPPEFALFRNFHDLPNAQTKTGRGDFFVSSSILGCNLDAAMRVVLPLVPVMPVMAMRSSGWQSSNDE